MKKYSLNNGYGTTYDFTIVDKIPNMYQLWNIPDITIGNKCYVPFCLLLYPNTDNYTINKSNLLLIEMDKQDANFIKHVSMRYGMNSLLTTKKKYNLYKDTRKKTLAKRAIEIYKNITIE